MDMLLGSMLPMADILREEYRDYDAVASMAQVKQGIGVSAMNAIDIRRGKVQTRRSRSTGGAKIQMHG